MTVRKQDGDSPKHLVYNATRVAYSPLAYIRSTSEHNVEPVFVFLS